MEGSSVDPSGTMPLSWLPEQHEEQVQLAFRIFQSAYKSKVQQLENELRTVRSSNEEKAQTIGQLQKKNSSLEVEVLESHQRAQQLHEENRQLLGTTRTLRKQVERLEGLKKAVMSSIQDEQQHSAPDESRLFMKEEYLHQVAPLSLGDMPAAGAPGNLRPQQHQQQQALMGHMGHASQSSSPVPQPYNPAQHAMGVTPGGGQDFGAPSQAGMVDGKAFFRATRSRLSQDSFHAFLSNIKKLNAHEQSREQTLAEAQRIFGHEHHDLYQQFVHLLSPTGAGLG